MTRRKKTKWELIDEHRTGGKNDYELHRTERLGVPGGWLYRLTQVVEEHAVWAEHHLRFTDVVVMTFVPNPRPVGKI